MKVYKKNEDNLFCSDYIISENEMDLTLVGGLEDLFELSKESMDVSNLYCEDRIFSDFCQLRMMKVKGQDLLWRKIAYIKCGYNGNLFCSHEIILSPGEAEPEHEIYQQSYYGLTENAVKELEIRF